MSSAPVFIIASERSGSNLLRKLISVHPDFYGPVSPHILNVFSNVLPFYYRNKQLNANLLLGDMLKLVNHPYHHWNMIESDLKHNDFQGKDFLDLFNILYSSVAIKNGAINFVAKEINSQQFLFQLLFKFPNARFIYLYRNPLDVIASWKLSSLKGMSAKGQALKWVREQKEIWLAEKTFSFPIFSLSYEDLVSKPEMKMREIFQYLNIIDKPLNIHDFSQGEDLTWNDFWKNLNKPIDTSSIGKYKDVLTNEEIESVLSVVNFQAKELGYQYESSSMISKEFSLSKRILNKMGLKKIDDIKEWDEVKNEMLNDKLNIVRQIKSKIYLEYQKEI